jgi:hypothetical protein
MTILSLTPQSTAKLTFVATGDKHLLALERFEGIQVVTVNAALRLLSPR